MRDVAPADRLHGFRETGFVAGSDEQMHRAGHQRVSVDGEMVVTGGRAQAFDKKLVVRSFDESGLLIETAQDDVLRLFGNIESC